MKKHFLLLVAVLVALAIRLPAKDAAPNSGYFPAGAVNPAALLPAPSPLQSDLVEKEVEFILTKQSTRTEAEVARIKQEEHYNVYLFQDVAGDWFSPGTSGNTPRLTALLEKVAETARPLVVQAKDAWKRPRPFLINSRIYPSIERPKDFAYPSGHSTRSILDALVLGQIMSDLQGPLMTRAYQIGNDQVIAGVQFPSDILVGRKFAQAIFDKLMSSPDFKEDLAGAKTEIVALRKSQL